MKTRPEAMPTMHNPGDHAMGLELEIVELVARQREARRFARPAEAADLAVEIRALQSELALTATLATLMAEPGEPRRRVA